MTLSLLEQLNKNAAELIYCDLEPNEFRFVYLQASVTGPIVCELCSTYLNDVPVDEVQTIRKFDFEALSYVWGTQKDPPIIQLNRTPFHVTQNLFDALHQLRFYDRTRVLWVDALCIDQTDVTEKNTQVRLMHRVCTQAKQVIGWLGLEDDSSSHVMRIAHESSEYYGSKESKRWLNGRDVLKNLTALTEFLQKDYWSRLWVVQEIGLAARVLWVCGTDSIDDDIMNHFQEQFLFLYENEPAKLLAAQNRSSEAWYLHESNQRGPISLFPPGLSMALALRQTKCADLRDRVYGMCSLFDPSVQQLLAIDYSPNVVDVFINATMAFLLGTRRLSLVSWPKFYAEPEEHHLYATSLPTWVPDWGSTIHPRPFASWHEELPDLAEFEVLAGNQLRCKGRMEASITFLHECKSLE
jgi:hypothetical protein